MQTDPLLLDRARRMRREMTEPETRLWLALRGRRCQNTKFTRQVPVGPYIADLCARSARLIIEVDGDTHTDQSRDDRRTTALMNMGYRVLRFANADIMTNMDGVLHQISVALAAALTQPSPRREEGYRMTNHDRAFARGSSRPPAAVRRCRRRDRIARAGGDPRAWL
ncbi:endonuclease domain-containing protein [Sphingomonas sp. LR60]|uniref:endonuclease domain-containing protein n=1 Tax=Sphingomonas sp. LR60 TaxID=3050233 RepID=UPI002FE2FF37